MMAGWKQVPDLQNWLLFSTILVQIIQIQSLENQILYTDGPDCNRKVELGAATVYSHYRPDASDTYSHLQECQITFIAKKEDWKLKLSFDYLDIPDYLYNGVCTDALYLYDSQTVGERAFRQAGSNNGLCGSDVPPIITSTGPYISVFFRTDSTGTRGRGFKFQITSFTEDLDEGSCSQTYFYCKSTGRCIESYLACDRIDHCMNGEDEERDGYSQCNPTQEVGIWQTILSLGIAGFVGIIIGGLIVVILLIVCVVCTCRRCGKPPGEPEHRQSIPTSTHGSVGGGQPQTIMSKDGVQYQQVPQTAPHMNHQMMQQPPPNQYQQAPQGGPTYCAMGSINQQNIPNIPPQRGYMLANGGQMVHPAMEMQQIPPQAHHQHPAHPHHGVMSLPQSQHPSQQQMMSPQQQPPMVGPSTIYNNYNSPFHAAARAESHSYSSGYSSQQQGPAGGFQPMHTKPIMPQRGYTPTSGSSRSSRSRSESSMTYSKGDNPQSHDRARLAVNL